MFAAQLEPNCCRLPQTEQSLIALGPRNAGTLRGRYAGRWRPDPVKNLKNLSLPRCRRPAEFDNEDGDGHDEMEHGRHFSTRHLRV